MRHGAFLWGYEQDKLLKATKDSNKTSIEIIHGLMAQTIKDRLFNHVSPAVIASKCAEEESSREEKP